MNSNFHERFKNRASFLTRQGISDFSSLKIVSKPKISQIFPLPNESYPPINTTRNLHSSIITSPREHHDSQIHIDPEIQNKRDFKYPSARMSSENKFKPYSILDYRSIKLEKYNELRGLGPNIGSEDWKKKRRIMEKRERYGQLAQVNNLHLSPRCAEQVKKSSEKFLNIHKNSQIIKKNPSAPILKPITLKNSPRSNTTFQH